MGVIGVFALGRGLATFDWRTDRGCFFAFSLMTLWTQACKDVLPETDEPEGATEHGHVIATARNLDLSCERARNVPIGADRAPVGL